MKDKAKQIFERHGILLSGNEINTLGDAIQELLETIADKVGEDEPYAVNTVKMLRDAGSEIVEFLNE